MPGRAESTHKVLEEQFSMGCDRRRIIEDTTALTEVLGVQYYYYFVWCKWIAKSEIQFVAAAL